MGNQESLSQGSHRESSLHASLIQGENQRLSPYNGSEKIEEAFRSPKRGKILVIDLEEEAPSVLESSQSSNRLMDIKLEKEERESSENSGLEVPMIYEDDIDKCQQGSAVQLDIRNPSRAGSVAWSTTAADDTKSQIREILNDSSLFAFDDMEDSDERGSGAEEDRIKHAFMFDSMHEVNFTDHEKDLEDVSVAVSDQNDDVLNEMDKDLENASQKSDSLKNVGESRPKSDKLSMDISGNNNFDNDDSSPEDRSISKIQKPESLIKVDCSEKHDALDCSYANDEESHSICERSVARIIDNSKSPEISINCLENVEVRNESGEQCHRNCCGALFKRHLIKEYPNLPLSIIEALVKDQFPLCGSKFTTPSFISLISKNYPVGKADNNRTLIQFVGGAELRTQQDQGRTRRKPIAKPTAKRGKARTFKSKNLS